MRAHRPGYDNPLSATFLNVRVRLNGEVVGFRCTGGKNDILGLIPMRLAIDDRAPSTAIRARLPEATVSGDCQGLKKAEKRVWRTSGSRGVCAWIVEIGGSLFCMIFSTSSTCITWKGYFDQKRSTRSSLFTSPTDSPDGRREHQFQL